MKEILSQREMEVIELLANGMSNKKISGILNITVGTVKTHINNILNKLGLSNRYEVIVYFLNDAKFRK